MKTKRVKPPASTPGAFVLSATDLIGIDPDTGILRLRGGLRAGAVKIKGIDVEGLKAEDRETVFLAWGAAEKSCGLKHKIVLCDVRPVFTSQQTHVERLLKRTEHPFRRSILERELSWIEHFKKTQKDREGFVMFFSDDPDEIADACRRYAGHLNAAQIQCSTCDWSDCLLLIKIMLQSAS